MNTVLDAEKNIGIETFFTKTSGIGGKLRVIPEDFKVKEISNYPEEDKVGIYSIADVTSVNWETNNLIREISNRLHISRQRVGFAGTKDKRAKTTQAMSFYKISKEKIESIKIKDVEIKNIYHADKGIKIGNLTGNNFEISIRGIKKDKEGDQVRVTSNQILKAGGFPNFFGIQRFGIIRPITHIVGKNIVNDDFEKAVMTYIANPILGEDEDVFSMRKQLQETYDFSYALKNYPKVLNFEISILNKLVVSPEDFIGAIKELPKNLLTMFIYAYQSYLFNKILSMRIKKGISINQAIVGDIILPVRSGVIEEREIKVTTDNIDKVNFQISRGKAVVTGVLFGYNSTFADGEMGEIEQKIIEKEKIDPRDFIIPDFPMISSSGSRRSIISNVKKIDYKIFDKTPKNEDKICVLNFDLNKGCYATCLLREFMKAEDIKNY